MTSPFDAQVGVPVEIPDTPWTQLDKLIIEYIDGYELCDCEDADGNTGDYKPNEHEQMLIHDAIQGLIGDETIVRKIIEAREFTRKFHREMGACEDCGKVEGHWPGYACSESDAGDDGTLKNNEEKRIDAVSMREACGIHMDVDLSSKKGAGDVGGE